VDVSPDTKRVAVHRHDANGGDIVVFEPRGSDTRLTLDASQHNSSPVWSPDGNQIVFASLRNGKWSLYKTLSTRSGSQELLYESDLPLAPMSWSLDGKRIVFWVQDPKTAGDIWVLTVEDKKAAKLIATAANEIHPQISPDGKWIAYTDNSKDDRNEIYVQPFPSGTDRYQISNNGGDWPRWRGDSKELFYHSVGAVGTPGVNAGAIPFSGTLYSASIGVNASGALEPGAPQEVEIVPVLNLPHSGGSYHTYAVDPKGDRFLVMQYFPSGGPASANTQIGPDTFSGLTVALNWAAALKK
jgi:Tol biopolymer transport system component